MTSGEFFADEGSLGAGQVVEGLAHGVGLVNLVDRNTKLTGGVGCGQEAAGFARRGDAGVVAGIARDDRAADGDGGSRE